MNPIWIQGLWSRIGQEWDAIPEAVKPWGVWITLRAPLAADVDHPLQRDASLVQAWFLEAGMKAPHKRSVWAFTRFWVMHFERPWDAASRASLDPWFSTRCYPIAMAAFAPFTDSQDVYLETLWGGRWGLGGRLTLTPEGLIERGRNLWIS